MSVQPTSEKVILSQLRRMGGACKAEGQVAVASKADLKVMGAPRFLLIDESIKLRPTCKKQVLLTAG